MTKKWRLKVDFQGHKRGDVWPEINVIIDGWIGVPCKSLPDIFEPIEEKSDEEVVADLVYKIMSDYDGRKRVTAVMIAKAFIGYGLPVDKIRKERD